MALCDKNIIEGPLLYCTWMHVTSRVPVAGGCLGICPVHLYLWHGGSNGVFVHEVFKWQQIWGSQYIPGWGCHPERLRWVGWMGSTGTLWDSTMTCTWVMHKVMHLRKRKYLQPYRLGSSFPEKPPGDMVHSELNMSHQCALAAKKDPGLY